MKGACLPVSFGLPRDVGATSLQELGASELHGNVASLGLEVDKKLRHLSFVVCISGLRSGLPRTGTIASRASRWIYEERA